jgi:hypothetical protein
MLLVEELNKQHELDFEWIVIFCTHFQTSFGYKVWTEEVADWRNCIQNWTVILPLLVSSGG